MMESAIWASSDGNEGDYSGFFMTFGLGRLTAKVLLISATLAITSAARPAAGIHTIHPGAMQMTPAQSTAIQPTADNDAALDLPTEVRVRRLHLVRPDLIRYPIAYEVVC